MSSKSAFRNWVRDDELLNRDLQDIMPINIPGGIAYENITSQCPFILVDYLTWLSGVNPKEPNLTAGELHSRILKSLLKLLDRNSNGQYLLLSVDKGHVSIAKGGTQEKRRNALNALSDSACLGKLELKLAKEVREQHRWSQVSDDVKQNIPQGMTFEEAVQAGIVSTRLSDQILKREQTRQKRVDFHHQRVQDLALQRLDTQDRLTLLDSDIPNQVFTKRNVDVNGLSTVQRALLAVYDTSLPQPWPDVVSQHRPQLMRWLVRSLMCGASRSHICPNRGSVLIVDGHCMSMDQAPNASDEQLARAPPKRKERVEDDIQAQLDTPLVFLHPEDAIEKNVHKHNINIKSWQETYQESAEDIVAMDPDESFRYNAEQSDTQIMDVSTLLLGDRSLLRPRPVVVPDTNFYNTVGEADMGLFFYALELMRLHPEKPAIVELVSVDTDIFILGLWFLYKWQNNMFAPHFETKHLPLPLLLHTSGRGWSTAGLKNGTMNVTAAYQRLIAVYLDGKCDRILALIGAVVSFAGDYTSAPYNGIVMTRFINALLNYQTKPSSIRDSPTPYLSRLVEYYWNVEQERWLPRVNGVVFCNLIRCVFFDTYKTAVTQHYMDVTHPWDISLSQLRTLINVHVTKSVNQKAVVDPSMNDLSVDAYVKLFKALKKRLPPDEQLKVRCLSLLHVMLMYADVGLDHVRQYDLTQLGFCPKDPSKPMTRDNIKSLATDDWEGRRDSFFANYGFDIDDCKG